MVPHLNIILGLDWSFILYERPVLDNEAKPHFVAKS